MGIKKTLNFRRAFFVTPWHLYFHNSIIQFLTIARLGKDETYYNGFDTEWFCSNLKTGLGRFIKYMVYNNIVIMVKKIRRRVYGLLTSLIHFFLCSSQRSKDHWLTTIHHHFQHFMSNLHQ